MDTISLTPPPIGTDILGPATFSSTPDIASVLVPATQQSVPQSSQQTGARLEQDPALIQDPALTQGLAPTSDQAEEPVAAADAAESLTVRDMAVGKGIENSTVDDLDCVADHLLSTASEQLLDKMLERRLDSIPARKLVNALARARRLGYLASDVVEESGGERVFPVSAMLPSSATAAVAASGPFPLPLAPPDGGVQQVHNCTQLQQLQAKVQEQQPKEQEKQAKEQEKQRDKERLLLLLQQRHHQLKNAYLQLQNQHKELLRQQQQQQQQLPQQYPPQQPSPQLQRPPQYPPPNQMSAQPQPQAVPNHGLHQPDQSPLNSAMAPQCSKCGHQFPDWEAYSYHSKGMVCQSNVASKHRCPRCAKTFTQPTGLSYHVTKQVCRSQRPVHAPPPPAPPFAGPAYGPSEPLPPQPNAVTASVPSSYALAVGAPAPAPAAAPAPVIPMHASYHPSQTAPHFSDHMCQPPSHPPSLADNQWANGERVGNGNVTTDLNLPSDGAVQLNWRPDAHAPAPAVNAVQTWGTTPRRSQSSPKQGAGTDSARDPYAHLSSLQRESLVQELRSAEQQYSVKMKEAHQAGDSPSKLLVRVEALRNSLATKQSQIRKKYNVRLRTRRKREEMEAENDRLISPFTNKKARVEGTGNGVPTQNQEGAAENGSYAPAWTQDVVPSSSMSMSMSPRRSLGAGPRLTEPRAATPIQPPAHMQSNAVPGSVGRTGGLSSATNLAFKPQRQSPRSQRLPRLLSSISPSRASGRVGGLGTGLEPVLIQSEDDGRDEDAESSDTEGEIPGRLSPSMS